MLKPGSERVETLLTALVEIESFVGRAGWDQPARLFALVSTTDLLAAEPSLAGQLKKTGPGALSSVEQEDFRSGTDLLTALGQLAWPATVAGCALATERSFLPPAAEADIPARPDLAAEFVAAHPDRQDLRVVAGALRGADGGVLTHCVARLTSDPTDLLMGTDLVPALTRALACTLN